MLNIPLGPSMNDNTKFDFPKHTEPLKLKKIWIASMSLFQVKGFFDIFKRIKNLYKNNPLPLSNWL